MWIQSSLAALWKTKAAMFLHVAASSLGALWITKAIVLLKMDSIFARSFVDNYTCNVSLSGKHVELCG